MNVVVEETKRLPEPGALSHSISISAPDNIGLVKEIGCNFTKQYETIGRNGSFSSGSGLSEIDPYDDIDVESAGTQRTGKKVFQVVFVQSNKTVSV